MEAYEFSITQPGTKLTKLYKMNVSDVLVFAPMGFFHPELFCIEGNRKRREHVLEETFDEEYLSEVCIGIASGLTVWQMFGKLNRTEGNTYSAQVSLVSRYGFCPRNYVH